MLTGHPQEKENLFIVLYSDFLAKRLLLRRDQFLRPLEIDIAPGQMNRTVLFKMVYRLHDQKIITTGKVIELLLQVFRP